MINKVPVILISFYFILITVCSIPLLDHIYHYTVAFFYLQIFGFKKEHFRNSSFAKIQKHKNKQTTTLVCVHLHQNCFGVM